MSRAEDENLIPGQYDQLNHDFYTADPAAYFTRRLRALVISIADIPALREAERKGIEYGKILMPPDSAQYDREAAVVYGAMESTNLLHHLAETIMRLYFAHEKWPECPWLEVARLRIPREFKERLEILRATLDGKETLDRLQEVFRGGTTPADLDPAGKITDEQWQQQTAGLKSLIHYLCELLLDDAAMYNATKHGLAILPSQGGMSLTAPSMPDFEIASEGPSVAYLDLSEPDERNRRKWVHCEVPVPVESHIGVAEFLIRQLRGLWGVVRAKYGYYQPGQVWLVSADHLTRLRLVGYEDHGAWIVRATSKLAYYDIPRPSDDQRSP